jgi:hypothetical protein
MGWIVLCLAGFAQVRWCVFAQRDAWGEDVRVFFCLSQISFMLVSRVK